MKDNKTNQSIDSLIGRIVECKKCPRLSAYIREVAKKKVKRFSRDNYWGRPLPGFGDTNAALLIVGLAPAAHGGNRTGRMFTGDSSGDWVSRVLYENGFATKPTSERMGDEFSLINTYITAAVRCAPPQNKPLKEELQNCLPYLEEELLVLKNIKVIICLGKIAFDACCKVLNIKSAKFGHGKLYHHKNWIVMCTYHPSRQNTQTGRLTWNQWSKIFFKARRILAENR